MNFPRWIIPSNAAVRGYWPRVALVVMLLAGEGLAASLDSADRKAAMAAVEAGDTVQALEHFALYFTDPANRDDVPALLSYAQARHRIPLDKDRHLTDALELFKQILQHDPHHAAALQELLPLYHQVGFHAETILTADQILTDDPKSIPARYYKALSLSALLRFDEAFRLTDRLLDLSPQDLPALHLRLKLMGKLGKSRVEIQRYVQDRLQAHPGDPNFQTLAGAAYLQLGELENARDILRQAAGRKQTLATQSLQLLELLESAELFDESLQLLQTAPFAAGDSQWLRLRIGRLWEFEHFDEILKLTAAADPADPRVDPQILAMRALILTQLKKESDQIKRILERLNLRPDPAPRAWAMFLSGYAGVPLDADRMIQFCRESTAIDAANPYLAFFLGESYQAKGEIDLAMDQWRTAARLAAAWAAPHARLAASLSSIGRHAEAVAEARQAALRSSADPKIISLYAQVLDSSQGAAGDIEIQARRQLGALLEKIQLQTPGEPRTLAPWIAQLCQQGKSDPARMKQASDLLAAALQKPAPSEEICLQLSRISRTHALPYDAQWLSLSEKAHGLTPTFALGAALLKCDFESPAAGKKYLADLLTQPDRRDDVLWKIQWAQYLASAHDPEALAAWSQLSDQYPDNGPLQRRILSMPLVHEDRAFMDRLITRVQAVSSPNDPAAIIARARWILSGGDPESDSAKAAAMLQSLIQSKPDLVEPRLLLATAMQSLDNNSGAAEQLALALNLQPANVDVTLALARLRLKMNDISEARGLAAKLLKNPQLTESQIHQLAGLQNQLGDQEGALKTLTSRTTRPSGSGAEPDLFLAELYFRTQQPDKAEPIYQQLMRHPSPAVIQSNAHLLGATGRVAQGQELLGKLKELSVPPAAIAQAQAEFARLHLKPDEAVAASLAAIDSAPDKPAGYLNLLAYYAQIGRINEFLALNDRARAAVPIHPVFTLVFSLKPAIQSLASKPVYHGLIASLIADPAHREKAAQAIRQLQQSRQDGQASDLTIIQMRSILDTSPHFLALHLLLGELLAEGGKLSQAADQALGTMALFPDRAEPAEQAVRFLTALRKWQPMLGAAIQWRRRAALQPMEADLAMARAYLNLRQFDNVIAALQLHQAAARLAPMEFYQVNFMTTRAYAGLARFDQVQAILKPLLPADAKWRAIWSDLATHWMRDPRMIDQWLEELKKVTPDSALDELADLADQWYQIGIRAKTPAYKQKGVALIKTVAARPDATAAVHMKLALLVYQEGDPAGAEAAYRRAVELDPVNLTALNNLALLILERKGDPAQALPLAQKCVQLDGKNASVYDTLGTVQAALKQYPEAAASYQAALKLQPKSIAWRLKLADVLLQSGDRSGATAMMREIDRIIVSVTNLNPELRSDYTRIKQSLIKM